MSNIKTSSFSTNGLFKLNHSHPRCFEYFIPFTKTVQTRHRARSHAWSTEKNINV
uniref:Uncharacterized protein n=1 Tax=Anguilla anguilla TaxID=7936 RepID=A0A0E9RT70_ANGAN